MKRQFIETADGSTSIYIEEMDEHYHSKHGAIVESNHIFIENGLLSKRELDRIHVFEVGMGTGLNVLTSIKALQLNKLAINYKAVEAYPIKMEELPFINFSNLLGVEEVLFKKVHECPWEEEVQLLPHFKLTKFQSKLEVLELGQEQFDVVYFDAFAPEKQEEMWTEAIFKKLFNALKPEGILVTYCVKGVIRRLLQSVGFTVEKLKGPLGGKREMCRATKVKD